MRWAVWGWTAELVVAVGAIGAIVDFDLGRVVVVVVVVVVCTRVAFELTLHY